METRRTEPAGPVIRMEGVTAGSLRDLSAVAAEVGRSFRELYGFEPAATISNGMIRLFKGSLLIP